MVTVSVHENLFLTSTSFVHFQNEREQIMTTNVWLTQVSVINLRVILSVIPLSVSIHVLPPELELNHIHFPLCVEQTASIIVLQTHFTDNEACH